MKLFSRFLTEASESQASLQAKKLNLKSDGHGGWLDSRGEFVAKTEDGKLKFFDKNRKVGERDTPKQKSAVQQQGQRKTKAVQPTTKQKTKAVDDENQKGEGVEDTITVAFGRFNPPTVGHEKLLSAAKKAAEGGALKIYPSRTQDAKKNPLDPDMKVSYMKKMFPDYDEQIINDPDMKSIFDVLTTASEAGHKNVNIIVGADRQSEFENLATKYNGELYDFDMIRVISAGVRDADAEGVEGMSASKMRKAVQDDDFKSFRRGTPKGLDDGDTKALYNAVRQGMGVKIKKESYDLWEIAPKYDQRTLREKYVTKKIFRIGDIVENLNTGLVGEIIRRGTNYLICVTKEDNMFKSWIRDVMEYTEVKMARRKRVPGKPNTLYGTSGYRKNAQAVVPGQTKIRNFDIKEFINKYRKND